MVSSCLPNCYTLLSKVSKHASPDQLQGLEACPSYLTAWCAVWQANLLSMKDRKLAATTLLISADQSDASSAPGAAQELQAHTACSWPWQLCVAVLRLTALSACCCCCSTPLIPMLAGCLCCCLATLGATAACCIASPKRQALVRLLVLMQLAVLQALCSWCCCPCCFVAFNGVQQVSCRRHPASSQL
eukprot:GHRR01004753.1.p1 GENE.GHRR01004753.1~~GHRR01004753.1.p1  ORF type:complete len:188 (-),score=67.33 GHRR01004753.1:953-1516(-)